MDKRHPLQIIIPQSFLTRRLFTYTGYSSFFKSHTLHRVTDVLAGYHFGTHNFRYLHHVLHCNTYTHCLMRAVTCRVHNVTQRQTRNRCVCVSQYDKTSRLIHRRRDDNDHECRTNIASSFRTLLKLEIK